MENESNDIIEGINNGIGSIGTGIVEGLKGVIIQPIQSGEKEGVKGVFKGIFKGVVGSVTKPISGLF